MLGIFKVKKDIPTLYEIKQALKDQDVKKAEEFLLEYLTSPSTYDKLSKAFGTCVGIIRFISEVKFSDEVVTASCNVLEGKVRLGIGFFLNSITTNADLLAILIHERNHFLIRKLKFSQLSNLTPIESNILEDAYINGPIYRMLRPPLFENYYKESTGLQALLHHDSNHILQVMEDSKYNSLETKDLYRSHSLLYKVNTNKSIQISYADWMKEGRQLALFLREKGEQSQEPDYDDQRSGHQKSSPFEIGQERLDEAIQTSYEDVDWPTLEDIKQTDRITKTITITPFIGAEKKVGAIVVTSQDFPKRPEDWDIIQAYQMKGYDLHAILVPSLNLDGTIGQILEDSWDISLQAILEESGHILKNLNKKLNSLSNMVGSIMSQPAMQDTGVIGRSAYPYQIHRRDLTLLGAGQIPTSWELYLTSEQKGIPLYVDVSYSMEVWYIFIPWLIQHLKGYIGEFYHFSTECIERDINTRILLTTGGTSFNSVAENILKKNQKMAIILTDNDASLSPEKKRLLKEKGVKIYLLSTATEEEKRNMPIIVTKDKDGKGWRDVMTKETYLGDLKKSN